ncbi:AlpA family transcriptional regulator [Aliiroseovarius sp. PrR006]|uniref:helix-turn-helix transcriptional regulator n=1 Tax=Aliiroseovarius sp. PrR006 TaxID=2706883 RepID=UPI0013D8990E|nr:helix-turn-helix domain-containing protein [Aliiroseovarius sp. PrR006]NDW53879.1 helix-turn-helix domain-containing protein [Aliiroseovarius sp. PrR006]
MTKDHSIVCEGFLTIPKAAGLLGIPATTQHRAVKTGLVPSYRPLCQRVRVRLSEITAVIEAQKSGGQQDG